MRSTRASVLPLPKRPNPVWLAGLTWPGGVPGDLGELNELQQRVAPALVGRTGVELPEALVGRVKHGGEDRVVQRELEVLALVAAGTTNREAAARLFISEATVKTHLLHIYAKLGVSDRAAAVGEAFNRGLLTPGAPGGLANPARLERATRVEPPSGLGRRSVDRIELFQLISSEML